MGNTVSKCYGHKNIAYIHSVNFPALCNRYPMHCACIFYVIDVRCHFHNQFIPETGCKYNLGAIKFWIKTETRKLKKTMRENARYNFKENIVCLTSKIAFF